MDTFSTTNEMAPLTCRESLRERKELTWIIIKIVRRRLSYTKVREKSRGNM